MLQVKGSPELTVLVPEWLSLEFVMLGDVFSWPVVTTIQDAVSILHDLQPQTQSMLSEEKRLSKLCLSFPIYVAASELFLRPMCRPETWPCSTMTQ